MHILWVGSGQLASTFVQAYPGWSVTGLRRSPITASFASLQADVLSVDNLIAQMKQISKPDVVIYSVTPDGRDEPAYSNAYIQGPKHVMAALHAKQCHPYWLHIGSCGVFGQSQGEWVHENTQPLLKSWRNQRLYESEQLVSFYGLSSVLRLGGIYGLGRNALLAATQKALQSSIEKPMTWSNRIHVEDVVGIINCLLQRISDGKSLPKRLHGVDHQPSLLADVMRYIADQQFSSNLSFNVNSAQPLGALNKRVGSRLIHDLNYSFRYPSYYDGYFV